MIESTSARLSTPQGGHSRRAGADLRHLSWRQAPDVAGVVLMGWVVVELILIRSISLFHAAVLLVGIALVVARRMRSCAID